MKNDGGAAFPNSRLDSVLNSGMTVRQFYKQGALIGLINNPSTFGCTGDSTISEMSGKLADAMIAEDEAFAAKVK